MYLIDFPCYVLSHSVLIGFGKTNNFFQCYKRILELDPENIQGLHNLCVVHVERGKLLQAQACLEKAYKLAPGEDYVLRHLQIVQNRIAKMKLNPSEENGDVNAKEESSKVVSNKSIDETERKTAPVVSGDTEEQRYSSRVVNTEPLFVQNVDNSEFSTDDVQTHEKNVSRFESKNRNFVGTDGDDPSSGML